MYIYIYIKNKANIIRTNKAYNGKIFLSVKSQG